ncbi:family 1 glycosylhydrolase [Novosphingobium sp. SG720]|uniref:glycoside hydrolase family 1 protein n=1 Tax=Novosphingobium sp. SG720 TaxID=2586998 RepID=UPI0014472DA0|nr:family 1 glycosylhydrolase [Novosphingobium sp. SG720]NKJ40674.1 beta-glucosidase [Novosphingobium sp. SG720]
MDLTRRQALAATATAASLPLLAPAAAARAAAARSGFMLGAGTSAFQVEGNNVNSDLWLVEGLAEAGFANQSGDACDHYHSYAADIALVAGLGLDTYRFSIEWARVEPREGAFSRAELDHYRRVLQVCRAAGLRTVVTLFHFTAPLWVARQGGFSNPAIVPLFARYAARVAEHCGDLIDCLSTINEANMSFVDYVTPEGARRVQHAAARAVGAERFGTFLLDDVAASKPIVREAHVAAREAVRRTRPGLPVGITLAMDDLQDARGSEGHAAAMREARYGAWLALARDDDYLGVQNYTRQLVGPQGVVPPPPGSVFTQLHQEVHPASLGNVVRYAASVARVPVLVSEHGIGTADDALRIRFIDESLAGLRAAVRDGVAVTGYIHWSLLDNYEWAFGYRAQFGLVAVDRATQRRSPKPSAQHLRRLARAAKLA